MPEEVTFWELGRRTSGSISHGTRASRSVKTHFLVILSSHEGVTDVGQVLGWVLREVGQRVLGFRLL